MRDFLKGLVPASIAVAVSYAVARWGYENLWYMGQLLPAFMVFYILLAWLSYLRTSTSFLATPSRSPRPSIRLLGHHEDELLREPPESKTSGTELRELFALEDGENPRSGANYPRREHLLPDEETDETTSSSLSRTLLWAALELAVFSTILYHFLGIGSRFF